MTITCPCCGRVYEIIVNPDFHEDSPPDTPIWVLRLKEEK